ncbi:membrane protein [Clostridium polyendosporum]|uniref:Membrane protein n=1 Tax=Clostridium polyendosporum TaxID=69208 RepID=A0A919S1T0_9CLOT|nr:hypothetical protein [Clostridium polyendosporum]GIM29033.1 membrane protein [Clostridium polyendosporum]
MSHGKLYRSFIILQEDERGYSVSGDKPLSGYAKIEAKNDKCKISFYAQNLRKDGDKCCRVLICSRKDKKQLIKLGPVNISEQGKAEATSEFTVDNIGGTGIHYEKISGAALCKEKAGKIIFLMVGFMNGEMPSDDWKNYNMITVKTSSEEEFKVIEEKIQEKIEVKKEEIKVEKEDIKEKCPEEKIEFEIKEDMKEYMKEDMKEDYSMEEYMQEEYMQEERHRNNDNNQDYNEHNYDYKHEEIVKSEIEEELKDKKDYKNHYEEEAKNIKALEEESKFDNYERHIEDTKREDTKREDTKREETDWEDNFTIRGSVGEFFLSVVGDFEEARGHKDIKYCKWYKVPVESLDVMCNISNYNKYTVVYYPMINYYPYIKKHGHFMIGFKCDAAGKMKYLVYAIAGTKDKSNQPYGGKSGFVTWMPYPDRGTNIGYWLMFYDFKNSMVVVPMK